MTVKNSLPFATCLDIVRNWEGELTKEGLEKVFSRLSREAREGQQESGPNRQLPRLAFWGSELAESGDCAFCHKPAVDDDGLVYTLPIGYRQLPATQRYQGRLDWTSDVVASVCKACFDRAWSPASDVLPRS